jgi:hypothetical protein
MRARLKGMEKSAKRGCWIAGAVAALVLVAAAAAVLTVLGFIGRKAKDVAAEARERVELARQQAEEEERRWSGEMDDGALLLKEDKWPRLEPLAEGEVLTLERYLTSIKDRKATRFAREAFEESARGARVSWEVEVDDVEQDNEAIVGAFAKRYWIELADGLGSQSGQLEVLARFEESSRDDLAALRKGDVVVVSGILEGVGETAVIGGARVVRTPRTAD